MYLDTKRDGEATTKQRDVWTLEAFSAWLDQQPADKTYEYIEPHYCAAATYLKSCGYGGAESSLSPCKLKALGWHEIVYPANNRAYDDTYGNAAARARAALAAR